VTRAVPAHHPTHQLIAHPLADQRGQADDQVALVGVAHEGEATDAGHEVVAPGAALDERGVEVAAERSEARTVEVEAADLAAERVDLVAHRVAGGERQALHRMEVHVEARQALRRTLVQASRAEDRALRSADDDAARRELVEVSKAVADDALVRGEDLACVSPAQIVVVARAGSAELVLRVERE